MGTVLWWSIITEIYIDYLFLKSRGSQLPPFPARWQENVCFGSDYYRTYLISLDVVSTIVVSTIITGQNHLRMCSSRLVNFRMETCLDALSPAKVASALHPWKHVFIFGAAVTAVYLSWKVYEGYTKKQRRLVFKRRWYYYTKLILIYSFPISCRKKWASVGKDVVILHQMARGRYTPNISPFPLKLETYLRMSGIPYEVLIIIFLNYLSIAV